MGPFTPFLRRSPGEGERKRGGIFGERFQPSASPEGERKSPSDSYSSLDKRSSSVKSRRDDRKPGLERDRGARGCSFVPAGLSQHGPWPSDEYESLGYFRSSLRDSGSGPAMAGWPALRAFPGNTHCLACFPAASVSVHDAARQTRNWSLLAETR